MLSCIVSFYQELSLVQVSTSFHTCSSLLSNADDNGETDTETERERDRQRDREQTTAEIKSCTLKFRTFVTMQDIWANKHCVKYQSFT